MNGVSRAAEANAWHLQGNWAPVLDEIDAGPLAVRGEIPRELMGDYVRAGMNPKSGWSDHWFAGTGMLHAISLEDGQARYRNRFVRTPYFEGDLCVRHGAVRQFRSTAHAA